MLASAYAMFRTDIAYAASRVRMLLRSCYAMSSTETAYAATRRHYESCRETFQVPSSLSVSYAMSGTDIAYGSTVPY
eukprot:2590908-Rhodomonas_salina.2